MGSSLQDAAGVAAQEDEKRTVEKAYCLALKFFNFRKFTQEKKLTNQNKSEYKPNLIVFDILLIMKTKMFYLFDTECENLQVHAPACIRDEQPT